MSLPLTSNLSSCPHGQRGTTTCLYCRQEARAAARHRRNRMIAKVGLMTLVGGILAGLAISALIAVVPRSRSSDSASGSTSPIQLAAEASRPKTAKAKHAAKVEPTTKVETAQVEPTTQVDQNAKVEQTAKAPPRETAATPLAITATPVIPEGRTDFGEGVFAERAGDQVTVTFDTDELRTRFEGKFERILRSTLPRVYGSSLRQALDAIPEGTLVRGDLLHELPTKGIALPLGPGRTLTVWPITREGRDGPIVDAYRASAP